MYHLDIVVSKDQYKIDRGFKGSCMFVLDITDVSTTAENILKEYKTQSSVEKKFQQLKSSHFVNALY